MYYIAAILGFVAGIIFYAKVLDKPEIVNIIKKQKRGIFRNIFKNRKDEKNY